MAAWRTDDRGVVLNVRVTPRASRDEIIGRQDDRLSVRLRAPPVDGEANDALLRFLAKALDMPRRDIEIVGGETGRLKRLRLSGDPASLESRLERL